MSRNVKPSRKPRSVAKYYLTEEYMNVCESTTMLGYAQVKVNGAVEYDFSGRVVVSERRSRK